MVLKHRALCTWHSNNKARNTLFNDSIIYKYYSSLSIENRNHLSRNTADKKLPLSNTSHTLDIENFFILRFDKIAML